MGIRKTNSLDTMAMIVCTWLNSTGLLTRSVILGIQDIANWSLVIARKSLYMRYSIFKIVVMIIIKMMIIIIITKKNYIYIYIIIIIILMIPRPKSHWVDRVGSECLDNFVSGFRTVRKGSKFPRKA